MKEESRGVVIVTITLLMITIFEIYTYKFKHALFAVFFVIGRIIAFNYETEIEKALEIDDLETITAAQLGTLVICTLINVGLYIYSFFAHFKLFVVLMIGEAIDAGLSKLKK